MTNATQKRSYSSPTLKVYGDFAKLTAAGSNNILEGRRMTNPKNMA